MRGFASWSGARASCRLPAVRLVRVSGSGDVGLVAAGAVECGLVRGWSGRCCGRAAGCVPQVAPFLFAVPAFGEVESEVASAVAGGAGCDRDQVTADRGPACFREREAG